MNINVVFYPNGIGGKLLIFNYGNIDGLFIKFLGFLELFKVEEDTGDSDNESNRLLIAPPVLPYDDIPANCMNPTAMF